MGLEIPLLTLQDYNGSTTGPFPKFNFTFPEDASEWAGEVRTKCSSSSSLRKKKRSKCAKIEYEEEHMSGKCSCRYGTFMKARGRLSWPMSTTCCSTAARISCQKRPIWTDWQTFSLFLSIQWKVRGIRMAIGTGM